MPRVNREQFLHTLESCEPGLSTRDIIEQSTCFLFDQGKVITFNDEVSCRAPSPLGKEVKGAVRAGPLLDVLRKLGEEEVAVAVENNDLVVAGKRRRSGVRLEHELAGYHASVEKPGEWKPLPDDFGEAVAVVQQCASKDEQTSIVCVHVHPDWLESSDDFQVCRWPLKVPVAKPTLIRHGSLKHVTALGVNEVAESPAWLHFRNPQKLVLSCRRYLEEFPDLTPYLSQKAGVKATLPKGLSEAAEAAQIFSSENSEGDQVLVDLQPGRLRLRGHGPYGWYEERKKVDWQGEPLSFLIAPAVLADLVRKHNEVRLRPDRLTVKSPSYHYFTCLTRPEGANGQEGGEGE